MRHVLGSTRASVWAAITRLVVLPVFTAHAAHLWVTACTVWAIASHLAHATIAAVVAPVLAVVWASTPWTAVAVAHHPGRVSSGIWHAHHAHFTHAPVVAPALLPLHPTIIVVTFLAQAHAHPSYWRHPLHAEVGLVGGIRGNIRNLNMTWASAAVNDLISDILGEHWHEIVKHPALG